eukprot:352413-Rhodomonas_salina.1
MSAAAGGAAACGSLAGVADLDLGGAGLVGHDAALGRVQVQRPALDVVEDAPRCPQERLLHILPTMPKRTVSLLPSTPSQTTARVHRPCHSTSAPQTTRTPVGTVVRVDQVCIHTRGGEGREADLPCLGRHLQVDQPVVLRERLAT